MKNSVILKSEKKRDFKDNYDDGIAYLWNALCFNWKYWDLAEMEKRI